MRSQRGDEPAVSSRPSLRTCPAQGLGGVNTSEPWFTLDNRHWPELRSRGREFKSRQPDKRWGVGPRLGPTARVRRPDRRKSARNWRPSRVPAGGRWRSFGSPPVMTDGMTASWGHRLMRRASPRSRRGRVRRSGGAPTPPRRSRAGRTGWSTGIRGPTGACASRPAPLM
jgi:hypothetical protein